MFIPYKQILMIIMTIIKNTRIDNHDQRSHRRSPNRLRSHGSYDNGWQSLLVSANLTQLWTTVHLWSIHLYSPIKNGDFPCRTPFFTEGHDINPARFGGSAGANPIDPNRKVILSPAPYGESQILAESLAILKSVHLFQLNLGIYWHIRTTKKYIYSN